MAHDELYESFKIESLEMLDSAEDAFIKIEKGASVSDHFDAIFRVFHSLKGGFSLFEIPNLPTLLHEAENKFSTLKGSKSIPKESENYFLDVIDRCRHILEGKPGEFKASYKPRVAQVVPEKKIEEEFKDKKLVAMCIDDENDLIVILKSLLEDSNFLVHGFTDPELALKQVETLNPDVIISDMSMPKISGLDVLKTLEKRGLVYPVVFCSGYLDKDTLIEAINYGADGVIEKPFNDDYVVRVATNSARRYRLQKMFDQTINLLMYQYSDFDDFLKLQGRNDVRKVVETEMANLIRQRRLLREMSRNRR